MSDNIDRDIEKMGIFDLDTKVDNDLPISDTGSGDKELIESLRRRITELENALESRAQCKRCGRELGTSPITVSDDVAEEYFRCMLGQMPFEKTFKLFDGRLLVTFRELSGSSILEHGKMVEKARSDEDFADMLEMYLLTGMLVSVETYDKATMRTTTVYSATPDQLVENTKDPKSAYEELLKTVGQLKIAVIRRACTTFEYLLTALIEKSQDKNFYEDAGLL